MCVAQGHSAPSVESRRDDMFTPERLAAERLWTCRSSGTQRRGWGDSCFYPHAAPTELKRRLFDLLKVPKVVRILNFSSL